MKNKFYNMLMRDDFASQILNNQDLLITLIPEMKYTIGFSQNNPYHAHDVFIHTIHALENCETKDVVVKLALLFHDIGKPHCYQDDEDGTRHFRGHGKVSAEITEKVLTRLSFEETTKNHIVELVYYHDIPFEVNEKHIKRWINKIGETQFRRLLKIRRADIKGQNPNYESSRIDKVDDVEWLLNEIILENTSFSVKDLAINGNDLIKIGYNPEKELGATLQKLADSVTIGKVKNNKEELLVLAKKWLE